MIKIIDVFTRKSRHFIVKEMNMVEVMTMIDLAKGAGYDMDDMSVSNCNFTDKPGYWFINIKLTKNQWGTLLKECKEKQYHLVIKDDPDRMYFTKIKA